MAKAIADQTVGELRQTARELINGGKITRQPGLAIWIVGASRDALVHLIQTGRRPGEVEEAEKGDHDLGGEATDNPDGDKRKGGEGKGQGQGEGMEGGDSGGLLQDGEGVAGGLGEGEGEGEGKGQGDGAPQQSPGLSPEQVQELINQALSELDDPKDIKVWMGDDKTPKLKPGLFHSSINEVLDALLVGEGLAYLSGPPGTGKSSIARSIGEILELPVIVIPCSTGLTEGQLLGREQLDGTFSEGLLAPYWGKPCVILLDELTFAEPDVLGKLNDALANNRLNLPNGQTVNKHPLCHILVGDNVWGSGFSSEYISRKPLDPPTADRFVGARVFVPYCHKLESTIARNIFSTVPNGRKLAKACQRLVRQARADKDHYSLKVVVSTRFLIRLCRRVLFTIEGRLSVGDQANPFKSAIDSMFIGLSENDLSRFLKTVELACATDSKLIREEGEAVEDAEDPQDQQEGSE